MLLAVLFTADFIVLIVRRIVDLAAILQNAPDPVQALPLAEAGRYALFALKKVDAFFLLESASFL